MEHQPEVQLPEFFCNLCECEFNHYTDWYDHMHGTHPSEFGRLPPKILSSIESTSSVVAQYSTGADEVSQISEKSIISTSLEVDNTYCVELPTFTEVESDNSNLPDTEVLDAAIAQCLEMAEIISSNLETCSSVQSHDGLTNKVGSKNSTAPYPSDCVEIISDLFIEQPTSNEQDFTLTSDLARQSVNDVLSAFAAERISLFAEELTSSEDFLPSAEASVPDIQNRSMANSSNLESDGELLKLSLFHQESDKYYDGSSSVAIDLSRKLKTTLSIRNSRTTEKPCSKELFGTVILPVFNQSTKATEILRAFKVKVQSSEPVEKQELPPALSPQEIVERRQMGNLSSNNIGEEMDATDEENTNSDEEVSVTDKESDETVEDTNEAEDVNVIA